MELNWTDVVAVAADPTGSLLATKKGIEKGVEAMEAEGKATEATSET